RGLSHVRLLVLLMWPHPAGASLFPYTTLFRSWVWIEAGVFGAYWASPGVKAPNVKIVSGSKGIAKGDIGVLTGGLVHHFIVADVNDREMTTVNGNSLWQGITVKTNKLSEVSYYYTVDDPLYNYLKANYGSPE